MISIHLMLLFICATLERSYHCAWISIHLMLLFIMPTKVMDFMKLEFQYISCYCLSWMGRGIRGHVNHFNTSHVTVYRETTKEHRTLLSHFNTSHVTVYPLVLFLLHQLLQFQYISCYCLSRRLSTLS